MVYQCQELKKLSDAQGYYQDRFQDYCSRVTECIRSRMAWSDLQLMRDIIFMLGTQGWEKAVEEDKSVDAIGRLVKRFTVPLQSASANTEEIVGEFVAVMQYAIQFISLSILDYRAVWSRLFHAPTASEWSNILILAKLLFSLPASNGKLERVFSQINVIKTSKRTLLSNDSLDDLLLLTSDLIPLHEFCPDAAIDQWWKAKVRRPNQRPRKVYKQRSSSTSTSGTDTMTVTISRLR